MASWDFCPTCNSGDHCCSHDPCDCRTEDLSSYSVQALETALKIARNRERLASIAYKKQQAAEKEKRIKELTLELKKLKAK